MIDLDILGLQEHVLCFESFKDKKKYKINENTKSIDLELRPNRMKKPPEASGVSTSPTRFFPHLYIQDELLDMLIDKYGKDRGEKTFDGLLNARAGAFYQQGGIIAAEKAGLINALNKKSDGDYWQYSYYELWKEWMKSIGQNINISNDINDTKPVINNVIDPKLNTSNKLNTSIDKAFNSLIGKGLSQAEKQKSEIRISTLLQSSNPLSQAKKMVNATDEVYKLIQRAYYAKQYGNIDIAKIFWDKAISLGVKESADGIFSGLDIIVESSSLGAKTYVYHLIDDNGISTEWEIPFKLDLKTEFEHEFGRYVVDNYINNEIMCERL